MLCGCRLEAAHLGGIPSLAAQARAGSGKTGLVRTIKHDMISRKLGILPMPMRELQIVEGKLRRTLALHATFACVWHCLLQPGAGSLPLRPVKRRRAGTGEASRRLGKSRQSSPSTVAARLLGMCELDRSGHDDVVAG
jgi:hypothetical protein